MTEQQEAAGPAPSQVPSNEQEESSDGLTRRLLPIPHEMWNQILKLAASSGIHYHDLVLHLLRDGLLVRSWEAGNFGALSLAEKPISPLTKIILEVEGEQVGLTSLVHVPIAGETITWRNRVYTIQERAWSLGTKENIAYLRLAEWKKR